MKPPFSIASSAKKIKYGEITEHCAAFFCARYRKATAVFASHDGKPATKDMKHLRRAEKHTSQEVLFVGKRYHHYLRKTSVFIMIPKQILCVWPVKRWNRQTAM